MIIEVKEYINQFPNEVQERLVQLHELILNQNDKIEERFFHLKENYAEKTSRLQASTNG